MNRGPSIVCGPRRPAPITRVRVRRQKRPETLRDRTASCRGCLRSSTTTNRQVFVIENPQSGLLKSREVVRGLSFSDTSFCKYGYKYRKATRIWHHNFEFEPEAMCCASSPCEAARVGRHEGTAQRGPGGGRDKSDRCTLDQLHSMPPLLCDHIAAAASAAMGG